MTISPREVAERIALEHPIRYVKATRRFYRKVNGAWEPMWHVGFFLHDVLRQYWNEPGLSDSTRRRLASAPIIVGCEFQLKKLCASTDTPDCEGRRGDALGFDPSTDGANREG